MSGAGRGALAADARLGLSVAFGLTPDRQLPSFEAVHAAASPWAQAALRALGFGIRSVSMRGLPSSGDGWADDSWFGGSWPSGSWSGDSWSGDSWSGDSWDGGPGRGR